MPEGTGIKWTSLTEYVKQDFGQALSHIRQHVLGLWAHGTPRHPFFTLHGEQHSSGVERNAGDILPMSLFDENSILSTQQVFFLLAAVWLHDVGMVAPLERNEETRARAESLSVPGWIRKHHHERSYDYITANAFALRLEPDDAAIVAQISRAHRRETLGLLSPDYPDVRFLSAVLRAADELDITSVSSR
jgi:hypothetical protein